MFQRLGLITATLLCCALPALAQDDASEMKRFIQTLRILQEYNADPINPDQLFYQGAIPGLVKHLDPHSVFFDKDQFEPSNNNRQVYARTDTWGRAKAEVTAEELRKINPEVEVKLFDHFGADNVDEVVRGSTVVVNGMDELGACVRLWRKCREHRVPVVDAWTAPMPNVRTWT